GTDDDCDGETDENYTSTTCGVGACEAMSMCVEGVESCAEGEPAMMDATCDLVDEDCDGRVDEDYAANAPSCGVGACARVSTCTEGAEACEPGLPFAPDDSSCNGVDDDCNGNVDEDYESDETCGVGACMRTATCSDGEDVCQPGEPLSEDDATCDGIDDNCNGSIDENCFRNCLGFEVSGSGDDFVEVDILYTRQVSPSEIEDGNRFLPRVMELSPTYPSGLSIGLPFNATAGQALVDAQKQIGFGRICPVPEEAGQVCPVSRVFAIDMDPDMDGTAESRMLVLDSAQNLRVGEGVLATVRFTKAPGDNGPWDFGWNADETTFAPSESYCGLPTPPGCNGVEPILELNGAMLQPAP
ncbi:MAG: MopE-related protein, partial [Planctomycetota bacterium]